MEDILISIITPVYNTEQYLKDCIESVINQTIHSWELILIDDGSSDGSGKICDQYAKQYDNITVIHKSNTGQFDTRLKGIEVAKGDYCTGLDSDDYLESNCIELLLSTIKRDAYDIVCWNIQSVENNNVVHRAKMDKYGEYDGYEFLKYVISSTNHSFCNKLIRTELLRNSFYGHVPYGTRRSEDYILVCPAICQAKRIYALDACLYNYRQLPGSVTHTYDVKRVFDYLDAANCIQEILMKYYNDTALFEEELKRLVAPVGVCLKRIYKEGKISKTECNRVRKHHVFTRMHKYFTNNNATLDVVVFLKLFRHHLEGVFRLL